MSSNLLLRFRPGRVLWCGGTFSGNKSTYRVLTPCLTKNLSRMFYEFLFRNSSELNNTSIHSRWQSISFTLMDIKYRNVLWKPDIESINYLQLGNCNNSSRNSLKTPFDYYVYKVPRNESFSLLFLRHYIAHKNAAK